MVERGRSERPPLLDALAPRRLARGPDRRRQGGPPDDEERDEAHPAPREERLARVERVPSRLAAPRREREVEPALVRSDRVYRDGALEAREHGPLGTARVSAKEHRRLVLGPRVRAP